MLPIHDWIQSLGRPAPYQPGAELWNDPHISGEMLRAHLDTGTDAASYKPETIRAICRHIPQIMGLPSGAAIADLGCGPGLYARELAEQGFSVTGIDRSESSIRYAREHSAGLQTAFVNASYLQPFGEGCFEAALMISKDYGVLSPENRKVLLRNIHNALKPGGTFALDVHSRADFSQRQKTTAAHWEATESGFWRPGPYLLLSRTFFYPEIPALCDLYAVLDEKFTAYRIWQTYFTPESIRSELHASGFEAEAVWGGLAGDKLAEDSPVLGILCRRA